QDGHAIAGLDRCERSIVGEEIARFADWTDDVNDLGFARLWLSKWLDRVVGVVEGRPNQVIHRRVDDDELLRSIFFAIENLGDQRAGLANQKANGLAQELKYELADNR